MGAPKLAPGAPVNTGPRLLCFGGGTGGGVALGGWHRAGPGLLVSAILMSRDVRMPKKRVFIVKMWKTIVWLHGIGEGRGGQRCPCSPRHLRVPCFGVQVQGRMDAGGPAGGS